MPLRRGRLTTSRRKQHGHKRTAGSQNRQLHAGGPTIMGLAPYLVANFLAFCCSTEPRGASTTSSTMLPVNANSPNIGPSSSSHASLVSGSIAPKQQTWMMASSKDALAQATSDPSTWKADCRDASGM